MMRLRFGARRSVPVGGLRSPIDEVALVLPSAAVAALAGAAVVSELDVA